MTKNKNAQLLILVEINQNSSYCTGDLSFNTTKSDGSLELEDA